MSLRPFFEASLAIQIHEIAALLAMALGAVVLWRRKGNAAHKYWGKIWVGLMMITALTSIFIHQIKLWGDYSPIHLLTAMVLINIPWAVWLARRGKIQQHKKMMQGTYIGGMLVAGGLTFLPGRLNHEILFGASDGISANAGWMIGFGSALIAFVLLFFVDRGRAAKRRP